MSTPLRKIPAEPVFPESDGRPMGETGIHVNLIMDLKTTLEIHFQPQEDVLVGSNQLLFYLEGSPKRFLVPDLYVVRGTSREPRRSYKLWEEGRPPNVVIEISSESTFDQDLERKVDLYELIGVKEYFIFDPQYDLQPQPLIGFRMKGRQYETLRVKHGVVQSKELKLDLTDTGKTLRLRDPKTGQFLLTPQEENDARQQAEAEVARLRAELARLQRQSRSGKK